MTAVDWKIMLLVGGDAAALARSRMALDAAGMHATKDAVAEVSATGMRATDAVAIVPAASSLRAALAVIGQSECIFVVPPGALVLPGVFERAANYLLSHPQTDGVAFAPMEYRADGSLVPPDPRALRDWVDDGRSGPLPAALRVPQAYALRYAALRRYASYTDVAAHSTQRFCELQAAGFILARLGEYGVADAGFLPLVYVTLVAHAAESAQPAQLVQLTQTAHPTQTTDMKQTEHTAQLTETTQTARLPQATHLTRMPHAGQMSAAAAVVPTRSRKRNSAENRTHAGPVWPHPGAHEPVSISCIIYSDERLWPLEKSLASLISQTYPNWEAIVLHPPQVGLECYARTHSANHRVRFFQMPEGVTRGHILNFGSSRATGHYLTFLRAGNGFAAQHFAQLASQVHASPHVPMFMSSSRLICLDEQRIGWTCDDAFAVPAAAASVAHAAASSRATAPLVPLDALALDRAQLQARGGFAAAYDHLAHWELQLRYSQAAAILESPIDYWVQLAREPRPWPVSAIVAESRAIMTTYSNDAPAAASRTVAYAQHLVRAATAWATDPPEAGRLHDLYRAAYRGPQTTGESNRG